MRRSRSTNHHQPLTSAHFLWGSPVHFFVGGMFVSVPYAAADLTPNAVSLGGTVEAHVSADDGENFLGFPNSNDVKTLEGHGISSASDSNGASAFISRPNQYTLSARANIDASASITARQFGSGPALGTFIVGGSGAGVVESTPATNVSAYSFANVHGDVSFINPGSLPAEYLIIESAVSTTINGAIIPIGGIGQGTVEGGVSLSFSGSVSGGRQDGSIGNHISPPDSSAATSAVAIFAFQTNHPSPDSFSHPTSINASLSSSSSIDLSLLYGGSPGLPLPYLTLPAIGGVGEVFRLVAPIVDGYGTANPVFAGPSGTQAGNVSVLMKTAIASAVSAPMVALSPLSLDFKAAGSNNFTSFVIPNTLPNGDTSVTIQFGNFTETLTTGTRIDFTTFVPGGVSDFDLYGFSPNLQLASDGSPPFIWGATYATNGIAQVDVTVVPEPSSIMLAVMGFVAMAIRFRRLAHRRKCAM